jgi:hypothetical protein
MADSVIICVSRLGLLQQGRIFLCKYACALLIPMDCQIRAESSQLNHCHLVFIHDVYFPTT